MTKEFLQSIAKLARVEQIKAKLTEAAESGLFEIRMETLLPEQIEFLKESGISYREVIQKQGTIYDINWD